MIFDYLLKLILSLHFFKNYGRNTECIDMELSYFFECPQEANRVKRSSQTTQTVIDYECQFPSRFNNDNVAKCAYLK